MQNEQKRLQKEGKKVMAGLSVASCVVWLSHIQYGSVQQSVIQVNETKTMLELENGALRAEVARKDFEIARLQSFLKDKINIISDLKHKLRKVQLCIRVYVIAILLVIVTVRPCFNVLETHIRPCFSLLKVCYYSYF